MLTEFILALKYYIMFNFKILSLKIMCKNFPKLILLEFKNKIKFYCKTFSTINWFKYLMSPKIHSWVTIYLN